MNKNVDRIKIENARIVFRNFAGAPDKYNKMGGNRNFAVVIDDHDYAKKLLDEGWNIKQFRPRDGEEGEPDYYLTVKVNFNNYPPHIYLCAGKKKTLLNESTVASLDYAEISSVDISINPNVYENINGRSGISAFVKTMYVTVVEDDFADKYTDDYDDPDIEPMPFN